MVDAAASLHGTPHSRPSVLLQQRYATETPLYRNAHCGLVVTDTGQDEYSMIITC